jgi:hypothetical protein
VRLFEHRPRLPPAYARVCSRGKIRPRLLRLRERGRLASRQARLQQLAEHAELAQHVAPVRRQQRRGQPGRRAAALGHVAVQLRHSVTRAARVQQQGDDLEVAPLRNRAALMPALPTARVVSSLGVDGQPASETLTHAQLFIACSVCHTHRCSRQLSDCRVTRAIKLQRRRPVLAELGVNGSLRRARDHAAKRSATVSWRVAATRAAAHTRG